MIIYAYNKGAFMGKGKWLLMGLVSFGLVTVCSAKVLETPSMIYKNRCANCHGLKADGVPKLKEQHGLSADEAKAVGTASQEKGNIYGPPLNKMTKDELVSKLNNFRNQDFDAKSVHSVMRKNMKKIEEREGKITDEKIATYIATTFGKDAK